MIKNMKAILYMSIYVLTSFFINSCSNNITKYKTVDVQYTNIGYNSDSSCTITGHIMDETIKEPLVGARIVINNTKIGAALDFDGIYKLKNVPPGKLTLTISYIGYETIITNELLLNKGEIIKLDLFMNSDPIFGYCLYLKKEEAIQDIKRGNYQIYDYYEGGDEIVVNQIASKYGFVVKKPEGRYASFQAKEYNNEMIKFLELRNGLKWYWKFLIEVNREIWYKKKFNLLANPSASNYTYVEF